VQSALAVLQQAVVEIAGAAREQATGIEQVNQAVLDLDGLTQQNAGLAEASAASANSMRSQAETLSGLLGALRVSASCAGQATPEPNQNRAGFAVA
jgi:methyl-accepting chemotaxis protein